MSDWPVSPESTWSAVGVDVLVSPLVEFEPIECYALLTDRNFRDVGPHLGIETIAVHAEVGR